MKSGFKARGALIAVAMAAVAAGSAHADLPESGCWVYKSPTISNTLNAVVFNATLSGGNITVGTPRALNGGTEIDLTLPVLSPDGATGYPVTAVTSFAPIYHASMSPIRTVLLPDTVTSLPGQIFDSGGRVTALETVRLPANLTSIISYAFRGCTNLTTILPAEFTGNGRVTSFGTQCFHGCRSLTNRFNLERAVTIGTEAFYNARKAEYTEDGTLYLTNAVDVGNAFANVTNIFRVVLTEGLVKSFGFSACPSVTNITPFLPASVTTVRSFRSASALAGRLGISNPGVTGIPGEVISYTQVGELDLRGSSVSSWSGNTFWYNTTLSNVWFHKDFAFPPVDALFNGQPLRHLYFTGNATNPDRRHIYNSDRHCYLFPKWNTTWTDLLADASLCTVTEMTAGDVAAYRKYYPGEPIPVQKVNLGKKNDDRYFRWWTPDLPTAFTAGGIGYTEAIAAEGLAPATTAPLLFNQTTYAPGAADETWAAAAATAVDYTVPAGATLTRGMKFTGYTLHQMSAGTGPNVRAPTAWTLYGKTADDGEWTVIDTQEMTAESTNRWAYFGQDVATIPARAAASLHYGVDPAKQVAYVAFRFVATNSYAIGNGLPDDTPIGLGEIEFFGVILPAAPVVEAFSFTSPGWESLSFSGRLLQLGTRVATQEAAAWATGRVEVCETADFSGGVHISGELPMTPGEDVAFTVPGLGIRAAYHARLRVVNAFGETTVQTLDGARATLSEPWEAAMPVSAYDASGRLLVTLPLAQLHADATAGLYYSTKPSDWFLVESRNVAAAGGVLFTPYAADDECAFVRVTITGSKNGQDYATELWTSTRELWLGNAATVTSISNLWSGAVCTVSQSGTNLTLKGVTHLGGGTVLDLNRPVVNTAGARYCFTALGDYYTISATWKNTIEELYLPDEVTSVNSQFYDGSDLVMLRKLRLPARAASIGGHAFRNCKQLADVENFLPPALTSVGVNAFYACTLITNDVHFHRNFATFNEANPFDGGGARAVRRCYFHGAPVTVPAAVFGSMTRLCFYVPRGDAGWRSYLDECCAVSAIEAGQEAAFEAAYPGEKIPRYMVKIPAAATAWRYLGDWWPGGAPPGLTLLLR